VETGLHLIQTTDNVLDDIFVFRLDENEYSSILCVSMSKGSAKISRHMSFQAWEEANSIIQ
jgi:hypothetical protein